MQKLIALMLFVFLCFAKLIFGLMQVVANIAVEIKSQIVQGDGQRQFHTRNELNADLNLLRLTGQQMTAML